MLQGAFPQVGDAAFVEALDQSDRDAQKAARMKGLIKPLSHGSAVTCGGKKVGFAKH